MERVFQIFSREGTMLKDEDEKARLLRENVFYKRLNDNMLLGLHTIYKEIAKLAGNFERSQVREEEGTATIFHEVSRQLEEVMEATLRAADDIMNRTEAIQENDLKMRQTLAGLRKTAALPPELDGLLLPLEGNLAHVNAIVEALSFQDLTGQRLKKVVSALGNIRQIVVQTYLVTELMLKKSRDEPEKDVDVIAEESRKQAEQHTLASSKLRTGLLVKKIENIEA
jgi:chemotaxis protein CheZ